MGSRRVHIAVLVEPWNPFHRTVLEGIGRYLQQQPRWSVYVPEMASRDEWRIPSSWKVDGAIVAVADRSLERQWMADRSVPVVELPDEPAGLPAVVTDWPKVGQLAVDHLFECGFRRFGFFGLDAPYTAVRQRAFVEAVNARGAECDTFLLSRRNRTQRLDWAQIIRRAGAWLDSLPRPIGVLAANDEFGRYLTEAAREIGWHVPDDLAVLGIRNIEHLCSMSVPTLSSVATNGPRVGYEAAQQLDTLLQGRRPSPEVIRVAPGGVIERGSTATLVADDPQVAAAVRYIREHACDPIGVDHVAEALAMSRRSLELRMRRSLGLTPAKLIRRFQMRRGRSLLLETDWTTDRIARLVGLPSAAQFSKTFFREVQQTPSQFRRRHRQADPGANP